MKFFKWLTFSIVGIFLVACTNTENYCVKTQKRAIGVVLPMSSNASKDVIDGMKLALQEINQAVDKKNSFSLVFKNSENPSGVLKEIELLFLQDVRVFCIGFDKEVILSHKLLSSMGASFFNFMMTYPPATLNSKTSTRIFLNASQEADLLASVVKGKQDVKRIAILSEDSFIGKSVGDYLNFSVANAERKIYRDYFNVGEKSFEIYASQITMQNPSVIYYIGSGAEFSALQKALKQSGFKGKVLKNRGYSLYENSANGVSVKYNCEQFKTGFSKNFEEKFVKVYSRKPSLFSAYGYDSIKLLVNAMDKSNFEISDMRKFFVNKIYNGASGELMFDSSADCTAELSLK